MATESLPLGTTAARLPLDRIECGLAGMYMSGLAVTLAPNSSTDITSVSITCRFGYDESGSSALDARLAGHLRQQPSQGGRDVEPLRRERREKRVVPRCVFEIGVERRRLDDEDATEREAVEVRRGHAHRGERVVEEPLADRRDDVGRDHVAHDDPQLLTVEDPIEESIGGRELVERDVRQRLHEPQDARARRARPARRRHATLHATRRGSYADDACRRPP